GKRLAGSGIAALEIGIPHSDPLADGPVIQRAGQVALEHGMTVSGALDVAKAVGAEGVPVVLMTYINPVLSYDPRKFSAEAELPEGMPALLKEVKKRTSLPVAAGFGISRQEHMKALRGHADAAVVGSAIVDEIERGGDGVALVRELLKACR